jgi:hypothetical protein
MVTVAVELVAVKPCVFVPALIAFLIAVAEVVVLESSPVMAV